MQWIFTYFACDSLIIWNLNQQVYYTHSSLFILVGGLLISGTPFCTSSLWALSLYDFDGASPHDSHLWQSPLPLESYSVQLTFTYSALIGCWNFYMGRKVYFSNLILRLLQAGLTCPRTCYNNPMFKKLLIRIFYLASQFLLLFELQMDLFITAYKKCNHYYTHTFIFYF